MGTGRGPEDGQPCPGMDEELPGKLEYRPMAPIFAEGSNQKLAVGKLTHRAAQCLSPGPRHDTVSGIDCKARLLSRTNDELTLTAGAAAVSMET
jgi:hypothetical protein